MTKVDRLVVIDEILGIVYPGLVSLPQGPAVLSPKLEELIS